MQNRPLTDSELNAVIDAPRYESDRPLNEKDLMGYFDTVSSQFEPSYKYMCPKRMRDLFNRFLSCGWLKAYHRDKIQDALKQIG
jgi:hypothetical protein